jgi:hypothetical protein
VERRKEPRLSTAQHVRLTILDGLRASIDVEVIDFSGRGMRLRMPCDIPLGTVVRIDGDNSLFLGEVCHCLSVEDHYEAGIQLDQVLTGLRDLEKLNENLIGEESQKPKLVSR